MLDAMLAALTDDVVVIALADLAGIDPIIVSQPANLGLITGPAVADLLHLGGLSASKTPAILAERI